MRSLRIKSKSLSPAVWILAATLMAGLSSKSQAQSFRVPGGSDFSFSPTIRPYSYYAAIPPTTPRGYVGYGDSGFVFLGQPYGRPNDRWGWQALSSTPYGGALSRYYYPPVR